MESREVDYPHLPIEEMFLAQGNKKSRKLLESDVQVGKPLPWSVHDAQGQLLLKRGYIVGSENQKQRLVNQRVYIQAAGSAGAGQLSYGSAAPIRKARPKGGLVSIGQWLDTQYRLLDSVYQEFSTNLQPSTGSKIRLLAERFQKLCGKQPEGLLAAVQLSQGKHYSLIKAIHVAVLCELLSKRINIPPSSRLSIICAGLTHDIAMWELQDSLQQQSDPLSEEQWVQIRKHPEEGEQLLKQAGVVDKVWLGVVNQHHERMNGSGYAQGLTGDKISQPARILAIADTYAAMVRIRGDRDRRLPKDALRDIFLSRGAAIDATLAQLFIKELGMFPPGSTVKLASQEIAIATGIGNKASFPDVEVVVDAQGQPLKRSIARDTSDKQYTVVELLAGLPEHPDLESLISHFWPQVPKTG
jgi:HD-GYP domain-containing protein (c-di-GMP phosphodiesterase class II)